MDGHIIGYVRIFDDPLVRPHGGNLNSVWAQKCFFFCLILQKLTLFDTPKNAFFAENLIFSNTFGFPVVNWVPKYQL